MPNPEITYDLIEPLVVSAEVEGRHVNCEFSITG